MALRQYLPQKPYLPPIRVERKTPQPGMLDYIAGLTNAYSQYQGQDLKMKRFEAQQARQKMLDEERLADKATAEARYLKKQKRQTGLDAMGLAKHNLSMQSMTGTMQRAQQKAEQDQMLNELQARYYAGNPFEAPVVDDEDAFGDDEFETQTKIQRDESLVSDMLEAGMSIADVQNMKKLTGETTAAPWEYIEKPAFTSRMDQLAGTRNVDATNFNKALMKYINPMLEDVQGSIGLPSDQFEGSWLDNAWEGHNWGMGEDRVDTYKREQFDQFKMELQNYLAETSKSYAKGDQGVAQQIGQVIQSGLEQAGESPEEGYYGNTSAPELAQIMETLRNTKLQGNKLTSIPELREREERRARLAFLAKKK